MSITLKRIACVNNRDFCSPKRFVDLICFLLFNDFLQVIVRYLNSFITESKENEEDERRVQRTGKRRKTDKQKEKKRK